MAKYRLVKQTDSNSRVRYSIQKRTFWFWKEIDYEYSEQKAATTFDRHTIKPSKPTIEILKER